MIHVLQEKFLIRSNVHIRKTSFYFNINSQQPMAISGIFSRVVLKKHKLQMYLKNKREESIKGHRWDISQKPSDS